MRTWAPWLLSVMLAAGVTVAAAYNGPTITGGSGVSTYFNSFVSSNPPQLNLRTNNDIGALYVRPTGGPGTNNSYFSVGSSGSQVFGVTTTTIDSTLPFNSTVASGTNAFACSTVGCRIFFGANYLSESGGTLTWSGNNGIDASILRASNATAVSLSSAGALIYWSNAGANGVISSNTSAASASPTNAALGTWPQNVLDADDAVFKICNSARTVCTYFDQEADITTPGYIASATPHTLDAVYVNNNIADVTYGGSILPARAFTVQAIRFYVRTTGSGGTPDDNTFRISDGSNNCDFSFACDITAGPTRQATTAGTCTFAASASLTYSFITGGCTTETDLSGNLQIEGKWQ